MEKKRILVDRLRRLLKERETINDQLEMAEIELASSMTTDLVALAGSDVQRLKELEQLLRLLEGVNLEISRTRTQFHIEAALKEFVPDNTKTRHDILEHDHPDARLIAWGGEDENLEMGSWPTLNATSFLEALRDEATYAQAPRLVVAIYQIHVGDYLVTRELLGPTSTTTAQDIKARTREKRQAESDTLPGQLGLFLDCS